jgi:hypothetical protein
LVEVFIQLFIVEATEKAALGIKQFVLEFFHKLIQRILVVADLALSLIGSDQNSLQPMGRHICPQLLVG